MLQPVTEAQKAYPPDPPEVRPRKVPKEDGMAQRGDLSSKIEMDAGKRLLRSYMPLQCRLD